MLNNPIVFFLFDYWNRAMILDSILLFFSFRELEKEISPEYFLKSILLSSSEFYHQMCDSKNDSSLEFSYNNT